MNIYVRLIFILFISLFTIQAQAEFWTPRVGDPDRKAILNAVRPHTQGDIGGNIKFVVDIIQTNGRWAYVQATPQRPGGRKINWSQTPYGKDMEMDMMTDVIMALLKRSGRSWEVVDYVFGPTDVHWVGWVSQYGLPEALFTEY